jgi:hypothetical protein
MNAPASLRGPFYIGARVLAVTAVLAVTVLLAEAAARLFFPQFSLPSHSGRFDFGHATASRFQPSGELGWEYRRERSALIDDAGFLTLHRNPGRKTPDERRVLVLGDSVAEVMDFFSPDVLAEWETRLSAAWNARVKVWALAVPGYGVSHYERVLTFRAPSRSFDAIIVLFCLNDLAADTPIVFEREGDLYLFAGDMRPERVVSPDLFARSHLYRTLWILASRRRSGSGNGEENPVEATLERIAEKSRRMGARLYAVVFPYAMPRDNYPDTARNGHALLLEWSTRTNVAFLDLHDMLDMEKDWKSHRLEPEDGVHLRRSTLKKAEDVIFDFMSENLRVPLRKA